MKIISKILMSVMLTLLLGVSCNRDHLYYETNKYAIVRLNYDWAASEYEPNGVTVYVYGSDGAPACTPIVSSNYNQVEIKLSADEYTIVTHSNSQSEFYNMEFIGQDRIETFKVRSNEWTDNTYIDPEEGEILVYEPEIIVGATLHNVVVAHEDLLYHYDKPDMSEYDSSYVVEVAVEPHHIVHLAEVRLHIDGAHNAISTPIGTLHGMARGFYFDTEQNSDEEVMEEFPVHFSIIEDLDDYLFSYSTRTDGVDSDGDGVYDEDDMWVAYNTFGLPLAYLDQSEEESGGDYPETDPDYTPGVDTDIHTIIMDLIFEMEDGTYIFEVDVTDNLTVEDLGSRDMHIIESVFEFEGADEFIPHSDPEPDPESDTGDDDDDDEEATEGQFDPTVDRWQDVEVQLPM